MWVWRSEDANWEGVHGTARTMRFSFCRPKQHTYACIQCNPSAEPFKDHHMWTMIKKMLVLMTLNARRAHCQGSKANDVR